MTRKQQGLAIVALVPVLAMTAVQLGKLGHKELIFGLSSDFFAGVLIGFTLVLGVISVVKLLLHTDDKSGS